MKKSEIRRIIKEEVALILEGNLGPHKLSIGDVVAVVAGGKNTPGKIGSGPDKFSEGPYWKKANAYYIVFDKGTPQYVDAKYIFV